MDINQFKSLVMKYKVHVLIGIGALILIVMGYSQFGASDMNSQESMKPINEQPQPILGDKTYDTKKHSKVGETKSKDKRLMVDIKGAVRSPNVYEMKENDRIKQLLDRAGVLPEADLSQINLSERLQDQKLIYIPSKYDEGPKPNGVHTTSMEPTSSTSNNSGEVSVN